MLLAFSNSEHKAGLCWHLPVLSGRLARRATAWIRWSSVALTCRRGTRGSWGARTARLTRRPRFAWWAYNSTISLLPLTERKAEPIIRAGHGKPPPQFISKLGATLHFGASTRGRMQSQRSQRDQQAPKNLRASDIWDSDGCMFIDITFFRKIEV